MTSLLDALLGKKKSLFDAGLMMILAFSIEKDSRDKLAWLSKIQPNPIKYITAESARRNLKPETIILSQVSTFFFFFFFEKQVRSLLIYI